MVSETTHNNNYSCTHITIKKKMKVHVGISDW